MVAVPLTESNRNLAEAVNKRINADGVMLSARASLWRLGGVGLLLMLTGFGIAAIMFGYSYINDDQALADRMATSFAKALEQVKIPISGNVEMAPGTVTMAEPGKVEMDKPGKVTMERGTVEMTKPGSVVMTKPGKVEMEPGTLQVTGDVPRLSQQQLHGNIPSTNAANIVTNYTVFQFVKFGSGSVVTGWRYSSSEETTPSGQFCYLDPTPEADVTQMIYLVRSNGQKTAVADQDGGVALRSCVWFNGQPPFAR